jgi:hypothetical protein
MKLPVSHKHTGKDIRIICEQIAVVCPFRSITVKRPALADFRYGISIEDFGLGAVDVAASLGLNLFLGNVVNHLYPPNGYR